MFFPMLKGNSNKKSGLNTFGGLNKTENFSLGEFLDMENMTSDKFPSLCPSVRKDAVKINSEITNIQSFVYHGNDEAELSGFTGVADGKFYYQDTYIPLAYSFMEIPKDKKVYLLNYGKEILIMPMLYKYSKKKTKVYPMFPSVSENYLTVLSKGDNDEPIKISFVANSDESWIELGFKVGDSLVIECDEDLYRNLNVYIKEDEDEEVTNTNTVVEAIVKSVTKYSIEVDLYNVKGKVIGVIDTGGNSFDYTFKRTLRVYKRYPEFENACIYANRLWLTTEDGKSIYASAPGKLSELSTFEGLSTDSWYTDVGDTGKFTGITAFRDGIIAFKENRMYHLLGDRPTNFNISKRFSNCGCVDSFSVCQTDTAVYFLGSDGIYEYSGGTPLNIGRNLGIKRYTSGSAFSDGRKYYLSPNGKNELYAYDRATGLWHMEALFNIINGVRIKNNIYLATLNSLLKMSDVYENEWSATLCDITENDIRHKGINDIFIRIENGENSYAEVGISINGGEFKPCGHTDSAGEFTFRVPVRFKKGDKYNIKISGKGASVISGIERSFYIGGGAFTRKG